MHGNSNIKYSTFIYVATVYFPECRFGTAAISTINTNKKISSFRTKKLRVQMKVSKMKKQEILFGGKRDEGKQGFSMKIINLCLCNSRCGKFEGKNKEEICLSRRNISCMLNSFISTPELKTLSPYSTNCLSDLTVFINRLLVMFLVT